MPLPPVKVFRKKKTRRGIRNGKEGNNHSSSGSTTVYNRVGLAWPELPPLGKLANTTRLMVMDEEAAWAAGVPDEVRWPALGDAAKAAGLLGWYG